MKKRPLCMAVLIVVLVLWLLPAEIWMKHPISAGGSLSEVKEGANLPESVWGEVCKRDDGKNGQTVYLKNSNVSRTGVLLVYLNAEQKISIGNTLLIKQPYDWKEPEPPGNPGQFDAQLYYQTQGIVLSCRADGAEIADARVSWLPEALYQLRIRLRKQCDQLFEEKESGVLKAMLLGDKTTLDPDMKKLYSEAGIGHLLAVSGLHISMIGMSLYRVLRKMGVSYWGAGIPAMGLAALYGGLTGMSTSAARAVTMFLLAVTADILGKSYDMLTALAVGALLLLVEQPLYVRNASFLLSFGAVLGIGLLYPALLGVFPVRKKILQTVLLSLSIQIFTFPLIQYYYYEFPLYSTGINLLVIPLMSLLMPAGILALLLSFFSRYAAWLPAILCEGILRSYEWMGRKILQLPGAVMISGQPEIWQIIIYYLGLVAFVGWQSRVHEKEKLQTMGKAGEEEEGENQRRKRRKCLGRKRLGRKCLDRKRWICISAFLVLHGCLLFRPSRGLTFTMLDVGQGDCLFLRTAAGTTCLIDGGSSDVNQAGTYRIEPFLKSMGIRRLDYVFVTHTDADHISGIEELLEMGSEPGSVKIGTLILTEQALQEETGKKLRALAEEQGIAVQSFWRGRHLRDNTTELICLHPAREKAYEDQNAESMVLQVKYQDFSLLLMGDLEENGECEILDYLKEERQKESGATPGLGACDILKAGHHGSRNATSEEWLDAVQPEVALISSGLDNSYGHPHPETVERLENAGTVILKTTECGATTVHSDGGSFWIESFKAGE